MIHRELNKGLWKIVADLRRAASIRSVPYKTIIRICDELESLLKRHNVHNLNLIPSREFAGAIIGIINVPLGRYLPNRVKARRSKKDEKFLKSLRFWIGLARDIKYRRKSEHTIAESLGLSTEEFAHIKDELRDKGWFK